MFALPLAAQIAIVPPGTTGVRLTFSQQGSGALTTIAGKKLKGVGVLAVVLENLTDRDLIGCQTSVASPSIGPCVDAGSIYAAVGRAGISFILPNTAAAQLANSRKWSIKTVLLDIANIGSQGTGIAGLTKTISMPSGAVIVLTTLVPLGIAWLKGKLTPEPTDATAQAELLRAPIPLKAHTSAFAYVAYRYKGDFAPKEALLP